MALILCFISISASAEFRWGPTAGVEFTDYHFKQHILHVEPLTGGHVGVVGEWMFPGIGFGVDFGVQYSYHGAKMDFGAHKVWSSDGYGNEDVRLHSLQFPFHLRFKYTKLQGFERKLAPYVFAGPLFSFHLGDNNVDAVEYPRGNVMLQFGVGLELFERVQLFGSYDLGISYEVRTKKLDNYSARPSSWNVGVTWLF